MNDSRYQVAAPLLRTATSAQAMGIVAWMHSLLPLKGVSMQPSHVGVSTTLRRMSENSEICVVPCGEGIYPRWAAQQPHPQSTQSVCHTESAGFRAATQPNGDKFPRHRGGGAHKPLVHPVNASPKTRFLLWLIPEFPEFYSETLYPWLFILHDPPVLTFWFPERSVHEAGPVSARWQVYRPVALEPGG